MKLSKLNQSFFRTLKCASFSVLGLLIFSTHQVAHAGADVIFAQSFEQPFDTPANEAEAARFLTQATFGPTRNEITALRSGSLTGWINGQIATPPTLARPYLETLSAQGVPMSQNQRMDRWFHTVVTRPDQLRQRMAFALSQILVISDRNDAISQDWAGVAEYWDILARDAFGNYRDLLEKVSLSPQMGRYLSHWRNQKANPSSNTSPDENYAREVMQLFSIGLFERNNDYSLVLDGMNNPIPTYDQDVVTEMAQVFTGFSYTCPTPAGTCNTYTGINSGPATYAPMVCFPRYKDTSSKIIVAGLTLPAGPACDPTPGNQAGIDACFTYCNNDLDGALDVLFNHPNIGPFVSRQLIQRFVTSNPSPQYIDRVATVFNNDGSNRPRTRGNLDSVIYAILLDEEARVAPAANSTAGKLREPLLRLTAMWRTFGAVPGICTGTCISSGSPPPAGVEELRMGSRSPESSFAQRPLGAVTVFNFYEPDYQQPGAITNANLFSPEFQIVNESSVINASNELWNRLWNGYSVASSGLDVNFAATLPNTSSYIPPTNLDLLPSTNDAMIEEMNLRLMYGSMSGTLSPTTGMKGILKNMMDFGMSSMSKRQKALLLTHLILISPEFSIQR